MNTNESNLSTNVELKPNNNMQKTANVEVNGKQIVLTLTDEQIAQITKETSVPKLVKSWEEAHELIKPEWYARNTGVAETYLKGITGDHTNVPSEARAKSVLAYCKLSVIVEALNKTAEKGDRYYFVEVDGKALIIDHYRKDIKTQPLYLHTRELAEHLIEHFRYLLEYYFMLSE